METYYVYWYKNPLKNNEVFYVGYGNHKRKCGGCRAYDHLNEVKRGIISSNKHKHYTIVQILNAGLVPLIEIIDDNLTYTQAIAKEIELQEAYKDTLTNIALGGDGGDTYSGQSEHRKKSIRKKLRDKVPTVHSQKWKEQLSKMRIGEGNPFFGKQHSKKVKLKCGAVWRGKKIPRELVLRRQRCTLYIIESPDGNVVELKGRVAFRNYFLKLNEKKQKLQRISWQHLLKNKERFGYKIIKIERVKL